MQSSYAIKIDALLLLSILLLTFVGHILEL